jgi:hypothetical protein
MPIRKIEASEASDEAGTEEIGRVEVEGSFSLESTP